VYCPGFSQSIDRRSLARPGGKATRLSANSN